MKNNIAENNRVIKFTCTKNICLDENANEYTSYGIKAVQDSCTLQEIKDISVNQTAVALLAELLTREKASIHHFYDIVLDFIS